MGIPSSRAHPGILFPTARDNVQLYPSLSAVCPTPFLGDFNSQLSAPWYKAKVAQNTRVWPKNIKGNRSDLQHLVEN